MGPARVFISYRREDSEGHAGRLYDALTARLGPGSVFRDLDAIPPGVDFVQAVRAEVERCDVLVAVIGPRWLAAESVDGGRRLDHPEDLVRLEIESALNRDIPVIPALVQGADVPSMAQLPESLRPLSRRNGIFLTPNHWSAGVEQLVSAIEDPPTAERERRNHAAPVVAPSPLGGLGAARKGSRLQCQLYVNLPDLRRRLDEAIVECFPALGDDGGQLSWVAPIREKGYYEPRDGAMLNALGLACLRDELASFWPAGGPVWDALATVEFETGGHAVVLVEGKSYPAEMYSGGTRAGASGTPKALESRVKIETAVRWAQRELGVEREPNDWLDPLTPGRVSSSLYQTANRLIYALWLRKQGVQAWFCHLLFVDDPTLPPRQRTSESQWQTALAEAERQLGVTSADIAFAHHVFLNGVDPTAPAHDETVHGRYRAR